MNIFKSKTFWTGVAAVGSAGYGYSTGDMTGAAAIQTAVTGALGIFLRMAMGKIEAKYEVKF